ncbi:MAG TPA: hypothetical protein DIT25_01925 [Candidatus Moranbacteria bacterium]|nr:hypothetical protein [Candidatus Moranbacteria bacterium]
MFKFREKNWKLQIREKEIVLVLTFFDFAPVIDFFRQIDYRRPLQSRIFKQILKNKWKISAVFFAFIFFFRIYDFSSATLWGIFIAFLVFRWDSRWIAGMALVSLASCPFLLLFKEDKLAEQMAVYAFFFLTMVVVLQIIELYEEKNDEIPERS